jgi:hypothetical protein
MKPTRRMMLRGAGGFTLALPFLPSLLPRQVAAGGLAPTRRFVTFITQHGSCWESRFFPADAMATETMQYAGRTIRRGALTTTDDGGTASLSPVLSAPSDRLTPAIAAKLNVLRGIDSIIHIGHNRGGPLGNPHATDDTAIAAEITARPTIDQVLAYSDWFYGDLGTNLERSMHVGNPQSYGWSIPDSQEGDIQPISTEMDPQALFSRIFIPPEEIEENPRPLVVDRVLDHYHALRNSNRRLSAADRQRLDAHIERMDELQRKLSVVVDCGDVDPPAVGYIDHWNPPFAFDPAQQAAWWQVVNDVVVAAMLCDTSRIAVIGINSDQSTFSPYIGDWHQDIAHQATDVGNQDIIAESYQRFFADVFLDLVRKLDVDDGTGQSVLDSSLVMWTQESGPATHECTNIPIVTAGGASGAFATGQVLDYRDRNRPYEDNVYGSGGLSPGGDTLYMGLTLNQYLGTVLRGMGLPREAYEDTPGAGYGEATPTSFRRPFYPQGVLNAMGEPLPWFAA